MKGRVKVVSLTAAALAVSALAACHDTDHGPATPPPSTNVPENFSTLVGTIFEQPANSTPVNFDNITLLFDVNEDPNAFNTLLM